MSSFRIEIEIFIDVEDYLIKRQECDYQIEAGKKKRALGKMKFNWKVDTNEENSASFNENWKLGVFLFLTPSCLLSVKIGLKISV